MRSRAQARRCAPPAKIKRNTARSGEFNLHQPTRGCKNPGRVTASRKSHFGGVSFPLPEQPLCSALHSAPAAADGRERRPPPPGQPEQLVLLLLKGKASEITAPLLLPLSPRDLPPARGLPRALPACPRPQSSPFAPGNTRDGAFCGRIYFPERGQTMRRGRRERGEKKEKNKKKPLM